MPDCFHEGMIWNARSVRTSNPIRLDPTKTGLIRTGFIAELRRRFVKLEKSVKRFLVDLDAIGLDAGTTMTTVRQLITMADPRPGQFSFGTDAQKLEAFNAWLQAQIIEDILGALGVTLPNGSIAVGPWVIKFIEQAYKKGMFNAFVISPKLGVFGEIDVGQFLKVGYNLPGISKVQILASRTFEELKGITAQMSAEMNRILTDGMLQGTSVTKIARQMADRIDGLTQSRALMIARTEIIRAHAEGQLDTFQQLGVEELGIKAEWSTAGDDHVCPQCAEKEGQVYTIEEARGLIPLHPNCRCAWIPSVVT